MNLHEHQAKERLSAFGVPVQSGVVTDKASSVSALLKKLGKGPWVVKAQVLTGGRGKAGGVVVVKTPREAVAAARRILGMRIKTPQSGPVGLKVRKLLICKAVEVKREIYAAVVMNRRSGGPTLMVSAQGGMDVETLAAAAPKKFLHIHLDPFRGLTPVQARRAALFSGLRGGLLSSGVKTFMGLSRAFLTLDALLVEVNPLAVVKGKGKTSELLAIDAKIVIDDNAAFRHPDLAAEEDLSALSPAEHRARKAGLSFIPLEGNMGCLVNGAGLAMATLDVITLEGGRPANFLDVGGGADAGQVAEAFRILLSDKKVKAVLVNVFGGIMSCDTVARGILNVVRQTGLDRPLVVRLEGNRREEGWAILKKSGLRIASADTLGEAARRAVAAAREAQGIMTDDSSRVIRKKEGEHEHPC